MTPNRALSLRQPWIDAVLHGGKRIENRVTWRDSSFRGPLLLHAAKGMKIREYEEAIEFMEWRGIAWRPDLERIRLRGCILGRCDVVDVIYPGGVRRSHSGAIIGRHPLADDPWYMGGFALVLDNVLAYGLPTYCRGMLGFWYVGDDVADTIPPEVDRGR